MNALMKQEHNHGTKNRCKSGDKVERKRLPATVSAMEKYGEISDLLRNLMEDHRNGCRDAERDTREVCCRDENAIHHIVRAIANEHHLPYRMHLMMTGKRVTVTPVDELLIATAYLAS